eukprot:s4130_g1.t1
MWDVGICRVSGQAGEAEAKKLDAQLVALDNENDDDDKKPE